MDIAQVYATEIVGFIIIGIILFKLRMPKAGLIIIALAVLYPLGSHYFGEVKNWISFGDRNFGDLMFTSLFPRIAFIIPIILILAITMFFLKGYKIGGILLGLAGILGVAFYGLYKWEQNLIDMFSTSSIVTFFEWETFFLVFGAGILLILRNASRKSPDNNDISGKPKRNQWIVRSFIILVSVLFHWGISILSHNIFWSLLVIPIVSAIGLSIGEPSWKEWIKKILSKSREPQKLEMRSNSWVARVQVTKLPQIDKDDKVKTQILQSWLHDFGEKTGLNNKKYFMEILSENGVQIQFGTYTKSQMDAKIAIKEIEHGLRNNFPSINLESEIEQIQNPDSLLWDSPIVEVKFPKAPYSHRIPLLRNIAQLTKHSGNFRVLIQFQETLRSESDKVIKQLERLFSNREIDHSSAKKIAKRWNNTNLFRIKVFYQQKNALERLEGDENENVYTLGRLLTKDILSLTGYKPKLKLVVNHNLHTRAIIRNRMNFSALVSPKIVDFHFSHKFPIRRSKVSTSSEFVSQKDLYLRKVYQKFKEGNNLRAINLGNAIIDGEETVEETYLPIDILRQSLSVFGLTRTGKSTLLANLLHKVKKIDRSVSFLIFGLKDGVDISHYKPDKIYRYDTPDFQVPWVCLAPNRNGAKMDLESLASYLTAAMGLLDNTQRYIKIIIMNIIREGKSLPRDFGIFMSYILKHLEENPYGESQGDIYQAIRDHILALSEERFLRVTQASKSIPKWFKEWIVNKSEKNGKVIYLDLRGFGLSEQRFIVLSIFHMILRYAEPDDAERLRRLLLIDEAHILFYPPKANDYQDSDSIGQKGIDKFLKRVLNEIGVTGTGLIFADQDAHSVLPSIVQQTVTKILFRNSRESAKAFTDDFKLIDEICKYEDHIALLQAGPIGESVVFHADKAVYSPVKTFEDSLEIDVCELSLSDSLPEIQLQLEDQGGPSEILTEANKDIGQNRESDEIGMLLKQEKFAEAFLVSCDNLFDRLIRQYRQYPSKKIGKDEDFIRNNKKDLIFLIESCKESISERFMTLSDKYDKGIISILQDLSWVIEDTFDGYMTTRNLFGVAQKYLERTEEVILDYFSMIHKIRQLNEQDGLFNEYWSDLDEGMVQLAGVELPSDQTLEIEPYIFGRKIKTNPEENDDF